MKLLFCSDLHLGRTATQLPDTWQEACRTVNWLQELVQTAIDHQVNALLIGGDLVDAENRFWEALGPLEQAANRLQQAGIRLIAVAGNHDAHLLPQFASVLGPDRFTLLGAGGTWETLLLPDAAHPRLRLIGWSFPQTHVSTNPLLEFPAVLEGPPHLPTLGIVHGDLGASQSVYAPLSLQELQRQSVDGWLLGHLHQPRLHPGSPWVLMPGSPFPLDPSETGPHHAWLLEFSGTAPAHPTPVCPAPLRYDSLAFNLPDPEALEPQFLQDALRRHLPSERPARMLLDLEFTCAFSSLSLRGHLETMRQDWEPLPGVRFRHIRYRDQPAPTLPDTALPLRRHLQDLLQEAPWPKELIAALEEAEATVNRTPGFSALPDTEPPPDSKTLVLHLLAQLAESPSGQASFLRGNPP